MGNFYTNVTLHTNKQQAVMEYMRGQSRSCFVSSVSRGYTTVFDQLCDEQDVAALEALATDLSFRFCCTALAVLNHDDDVLWIGVASNGNWVTTYRSDQISSGSAWRLAKEFRMLGLAPLIWFIMRSPIVLFEIWRHWAIASVLGIPDFSVGFGYRYLLRGDMGNMDGFERT